MSTAIGEVQSKHVAQLEVTLAEERECSKTAIEKAISSEADKTTLLIEELKKSHSELMESERETAKDHITSAIELERERSKVSQCMNNNNYINVCLRSCYPRRYLKRGLDLRVLYIEQWMLPNYKYSLVWKISLRYVHTCCYGNYPYLQHSEGIRRRQLSSIDLFLESAKSQLQSLILDSPTHNEEEPN